MSTVPELTILAQGEDWLVVDKPVGLFVHRSEFDRRAEGPFVLQLARARAGQWLYPVHRLDRPTSGAVLFAKSRAAAAEFGRQFGEGEVNKSYLCVVRGWPAAALTIDHPIVSESGVARAARTEAARLATVELPFAVDRYPQSRYALVRARPLTGRRHQIRRHLRHLGHPLIGDVTHGVGKHNRFFAAHFGVSRLLLHAESLTFTDRGRAVTVTAPLPAGFRRVLDGCGWSAHA